MDLAVASYYASQDEGSQGPEAEESNELPRPGRTLGGGPAPPSAIPTTSSIPPPSSATALNKPAKKFATLGDLSQRDTHSGHDHGNGSGDDNEEDYDDKEDQDLFAGGEKSGLAVKNPGNPQDHIKKIITRAKRCSFLFAQCSWRNAYLELGMQRGRVATILLSRLHVSPVPGKH